MSDIDRREAVSHPPGMSRRRSPLSARAGAQRRDSATALATLLAGLALACTATPGQREVAARAATTGVPSAASAAPADGGPAPSPTGSARPSPPAPSVAVGEPKAPFPPARLAPPHAASAQAGDGEWTALGDPGRSERLAERPPVAVVTQLHPHRVSRWKALTVVAIDLTRARVGYVPGADDVEADAARSAGFTRPLGSIPPAELPDLLAIFNGGFQPRHGGWGMMAEGKVLVPPRADGCTVAVLKDGRVTIATHSTLEARLADVFSYRQTPPCLVEDGALHPRLVARDERLWGGRNPKDITRRRSAIGIDATRSILFYGMGIELQPSELAASLLAAGAASAAQLDINWSWTRFLLVGTRDGGLAITSTLIPQMVHERGAYLERPAARDFFIVTRRPTPSVVTGR